MKTSIYTGDPVARNMRSVLGYDRLDLDDDVIYDMNTYRHWGGFVLRDEPTIQVWTRQKDDGNLEYYIPEVKDGKTVKEPEKVVDPKDVFYTCSKGGKDGPPRYGVRSLFNYMYAVHDTPQYSLHTNTPVLDTQKIRATMKEYGDCSIKSLVDATRSGKMGMASYDYSDFMYCKYLGQASNNYLITLRRFPYPAGDHINYTMHGTDPAESGNSSGANGSNQHLYDVGRLVTWMGTPGNKLEDILKYNVLMPYKELNSTIETTSTNGSETGGLMGTILNMTSASYAHKVLKGQTGSGTISHLQTALSAIPGPTRWLSRGVAGPPHEPPFNLDRNKNYGPVDAITKTHMRRPVSEGGIEFNQEISLVFDYELRSYDGINTRQAFLDLLANVLAVTYTNAKFWKGMYMGTGVSANSLFSNLPIYKLNIMEASWTQIQDAALGSLSMIGSALNGGKPITGKEDWINALINLGKNLLGVLAGGALNKLGRPERQAVNSLLSDAPVGLWHLTIGNPKHPIMSMGNMILDDVTITHYGNLGLDDFPTGLKVEIKLKHAMPRDAAGVEQMYMMGDYRIYQPMDTDIEKLYSTSSSPQRIQSELNKMYDDSKKIGEELSELKDQGNDWIQSRQTELKERERRTADLLREQEIVKNLEFLDSNNQSGATGLSEEERWARAGVTMWRIDAATVGVAEGTWGNQKVTN